LAVTCLLLVRLGCPHAPACASALVVATGGVVHWSGLLCMFLAVVLLTVTAVGIHRIGSVRAPAWSARDPEAVTAQCYRLASPAEGPDRSR
ncbi:MAG: HPP family protein, partial [Phycisphaerae bacterium]